MDTFTLIQELMKKPEVEIRFAILGLMLDGKLNFNLLNSLYVECLERTREDQRQRLSDANSCTMSLLRNIRSENKRNHADIHWALHNLNESHQFQMQELNEKFNYDKENDGKYSFYYREKHNIKK